MAAFRAARQGLQALACGPAALQQCSSSSSSFSTLSLASTGSGWWPSGTSIGAAGAAAALGWQRVTALIPSLADATLLAVPKKKVSGRRKGSEKYGADVVCCSTVPCILSPEPPPPLAAAPGRCLPIAVATATPPSSSASSRWWRSAASASACSSSTKCRPNARKTSALPSTCGRGPRGRRDTVKQQTKRLACSCLLLLTEGRGELCGSTKSGRCGGGDGGGGKQRHATAWAARGARHEGG